MALIFTQDKYHCKEIGYGFENLGKGLVQIIPFGGILFLGLNIRRLKKLKAEALNLVTADPNLKEEAAICVNGKIVKRIPIAEYYQELKKKKEGDNHEIDPFGNIDKRIIRRLGPGPSGKYSFW